MHFAIVPFVLAILRYALLLEQGGGGAPEELVLSDKVLLVLGAIWAVLFAFLIPLGWMLRGKPQESIDVDHIAKKTDGFSGAEIAKTDAGAETLTVSTTSDLTATGLGIASPVSCTFNAAGLCTNTYQLSMVLAETNKSVSFSTRGRTGAAGGSGSGAGVRLVPIQMPSTAITAR